MANNKPNLNPIEQQRFINSGKINMPISNQSPVGWDNLAKIADSTANMFVQMDKARERIDNLKMQNYEGQLNNLNKEMGLELDKATDEESFNQIQKDYTKKMEQVGKDYLGKDLYGQWLNNGGNNAMGAINLDAEAKRGKLLDMMAYNTTLDTAKQLAYNYGYDNEDTDGQFDALMATSGLNYASQQKISDFYHKQKQEDRLNHLLETDPTQIATLGKDGKIKGNIYDQDKYQKLDVGERNDWAHKAIKVQEETQKAISKGLEPIEAKRLAIEKQKVLMKLNMMEADLFLNPSPQKFFEYMQYINDMYTKPKTHGFHNLSDDSYASFLDDSDVEAKYNELTKLRGEEGKKYSFLGNMIKKMKEGADKTNFGSGFEMINKFITDYPERFSDNDVLDLYGEYYSQSLANMGADVMSNPTNIGEIPNVNKSVDDSIVNFVIRSDRFNQEEKNRAKSLPAEVRSKMVYTYSKEDIERPYADYGISKEQTRFAVDTLVNFARYSWQKAKEIGDKYQYNPKQAKGDK